MKTVYLFDPETGLYIGDYAAQKSPLEPGKYIEPEASTATPPPDAPDGKLAIYTGSGWFLTDIVRIEPDQVPVVQCPIESISALQGLLAIDHFGFSSAYESWSGDPARTFSQRAFINKAQTWKRNDPTLMGAVTSLGLTDEQVDSMFSLAATL